MRKITVINRNGEMEIWNTTRIEERLNKLCNLEPPLKNVDVNGIIELLMKDHLRLTDSESSSENQNTNHHSSDNDKLQQPGKIWYSTQEIDLLVASLCMELIVPRLDREKVITHNEMSYIGGHEYESLAGRIAISCLQKHTPLKFSQSTQLFYHQDATHELMPQFRSLCSKPHYDFVMKYKDILDVAIKPERDYMFSHAALSVLFSQKYLWSHWIYPPPSSHGLSLQDYNRYSLLSLNHHYARELRNNNDRYKSVVDSFNDLLKDDKPSLSTGEFKDLQGIFGEIQYKCGAKKAVLETPQMMMMRLSVAHFMHEGIDEVLAAYEINSQGYISYGTPIFTNSGSWLGGLISCIIGWVSDDTTCIYDQVKAMALASKNGAGIGLGSGVREQGRSIAGGGYSNSPNQMLGVFQSMIRHISQGGGKRAGVISPAKSIIHPQVLDFIRSKDEQYLNSVGNLKTLFHQVTYPDFFFKKLFSTNAEKEKWYHFSIVDVPELYNSYGDELEKNYNKAVQCHHNLQLQHGLGLAQGEIPIKTLWNHILEIIGRNSLPYVINIDAVNKKSNFQHLTDKNPKDYGIPIKNSNLCSEVYLPTSNEEIACCNLSTMVLPRYVKYHEPSKTYYFDFDTLEKVVRFAVRVLNNCIDTTYYPNEEMKKSNLKHRPIGIGIQGLFDTFYKMKLLPTGPKARILNKMIVECIQYASHSESNRLAKKHGHYESFPGSPFHQGKLQMHLWGYNSSSEFSAFPSAVEEPNKPIQESGNKKSTLINPFYNVDYHIKFKPNWEQLVDDIKEYGTYNSTLTCFPPTATTSVVFGSSPSKDPYHSFYNVIKKDHGEVYSFNKYLIRDLIEANVYSVEILRSIIDNGGSIQKIDEIPKNIKKRYKTGFELDQMKLIRMAADRGPFICMSEPMNYFMADFDNVKFTELIAYAYASGLKTLMYYIYTKTIDVAGARGLNIDKKLLKENMMMEEEEDSENDKQVKIDDFKKETFILNNDNNDQCTNCGS